jgi:hypothetical protein
MKKILSILISFICTTNLVQAQQKCSTMDHLQEAIAKDPSVQMRIDAAEQAMQMVNTAPQVKGKGTRAIIKIPVVVHVVYKTAQQNISDAQINSQIARLNLDFRLLNSDSLPINHPFWNFSNDAQIEFCLAHTDPNGNFTTGITRTATNVTAFDDVNTAIVNVKYGVLGGKDNWDPTKYLNFWVCNVGSSSILGFSSFPTDLAADPASDGVVVRYNSFGNNVGVLSANTRLGRTATHEVGHWLFLRHIWGDNYCASDFVNDTREAEDKNYGCPSFPHRPFNGCGGDADGEMYMNFMDYVDDDCMNMFTTGQINRMRNAISTYRGGLLTSTRCNFPLSINENNVSNSIGIYPNPSNGIFTIESPMYNLEASNIIVTNTLGAAVLNQHDVKSFPYTLNLNSLANGLYYVNINNGKYTATKKILISK